MHDEDAHAFYESERSPFSERKRGGADAAAQQAAVQPGRRPPHARRVVALTALGLRSGTRQSEALSIALYRLRNHRTVLRVIPASSEEHIRRRALTKTDRLEKNCWSRFPATIRNNMLLAGPCILFTREREVFASDRRHPRILHESRMRRTVADRSSRFFSPLAIGAVQKHSRPAAPVEISRPPPPRRLRVPSPINLSRGTAKIARLLGVHAPPLPSGQYVPTGQKTN